MVKQRKILFKGRQQNPGKTTLNVQHTVKMMSNITHFLKKSQQVKKLRDDKGGYTSRKGLSKIF